MSGLGVGVDVVDARRLERWADRFDRTVLGGVFTGPELDAAAAARRPGRHYAICFAAKEAVGKALGTGCAGIDWCDVESTVDGGGIRVRLAGRARRRADALGLRRWSASYAVCAPLVTVYVVGSGGEATDAVP